MRLILYLKKLYLKLKIKLSSKCCIVNIEKNIIATEDSDFFYNPNL